MTSLDLATRRHRFEPFHPLFFERMTRLHTLLFKNVGYFSSGSSGRASKSSSLSNSLRNRSQAEMISSSRLTALELTTNSSNMISAIFLFSRMAVFGFNLGITFPVGSLKINIDKKKKIIHIAYFRRVRVF